MITNCKNCGAPLKGDCEYCGTQYLSAPVQESAAWMQAAMNQQMAARANDHALQIAAMNSPNVWNSMLAGISDAGQMMFYPPRFF